MSQVSSSDISHYKKNSVRHYRECTIVYMLRYCYSCQILVQFGIYWQICQNYSNNKFHENPSSGSRVDPYEQRDRQTDMTKLLVTFRNFVNASTNKVEASKNSIYAVEYGVNLNVLHLLQKLLNIYIYSNSVNFKLKAPTKTQNPINVWRPKMLKLIRRVRRQPAIIFRVRKPRYLKTANYVFLNHCELIAMYTVWSERFRSDYF
jgi:hypothetical protein